MAFFFQHHGPPGHHYQQQYNTGYPYSHAAMSPLERIILETRAAVWDNVPPITRVLLAASLMCTLLVKLRIARIDTFCLSADRLLNHSEVWRLCTALFTVHASGFIILFHLYTLSSISTLLETETFLHAPSDYAYMLLLLGVALWLCACTLDLRLLSSSFLAALLLVAVFTQPHLRFILFHTAEVPASLLPWALLVIKLVMGESVLEDVVGYATGFAYWYLAFEFPHRAGWRPLETPDFVHSLVQWMMQ